MDSIIYNAAIQSCGEGAKQEMMWRQTVKILVASLLLVAMPFAPSSVLVERRVVFQD